MSRKKRLPYLAGDWVAIPLRAGGYAAGLVARADGKGGAIGYFFGPSYEEPPALELLDKLNPQDAILKANFGDLGLVRGEWSVIGHHTHWKPERWPIPEFVRRDSVLRKASRVLYREPNLDVESEVLPCTDEEAATLPRDGIWGYGAVEIRLTELLSSERQRLG